MACNVAKKQGLKEREKIKRRRDLIKKPKVKLLFYNGQPDYIIYGLVVLPCHGYWHWAVNR